MSLLFIIGIRLLAAKYRWSLPKIQLNEEKVLKFIKDEEKEQKNDEAERDRQARS